MILLQGVRFQIINAFKRLKNGVFSNVHVVADEDVNISSSATSRTTLHCVNNILGEVRTR